MEEDFVRSPDNPITQRLQEYTTNSDSDLQHVLNMSRIEYEKKSKSYEEEQFQLLEAEYKIGCVQREAECSNIRVQFNRLSKFDKNIESLNILVNDVLDMYINGIIQNYELDENTYEYLFKTLKNVRLSDIDRKMLDKLFIKM